MQRDIHKFSSFDGSEWREHRYPNLWQRECTSGPDRLVIAAYGDHIELMIELTRRMAEPFGILYVLVTPRGAGREGRYQNPEPVSREQMEEFLREFKSFFEGDGRHHIWITSIPDDSTIVYDQHNVFFVYGSLEDFVAELSSRGFTEGPVGFPAPHGHGFDPRNDSDEDRILRYWQWIKFPLQPEDKY